MGHPVPQQQQQRPAQLRLQKPLPLRPVLASSPPPQPTPPSRQHSRQQLTHHAATSSNNFNHQPPPPHHQQQQQQQQQTSSHQPSKRKSLIQLPAHINTTAHLSPMPSVAAAAAATTTSSSSSNRAMSKNAVEKWLRDTPLPLEAVQAHQRPSPATSPSPTGSRRSSAIGLPQQPGNNVNGNRSFYESGNKSSPRLGGSPSSQVPSFLLNNNYGASTPHLPSFSSRNAKTALSEKSTDGVASDRATTGSAEGLARKAADGKAQKRQSAYQSQPEGTSIAEQAPLVPEKQDPEDDQPLGMMSGATKMMGRMSTYMSTHSNGHSDSGEKPAPTVENGATPAPEPAMEPAMEPAVEPAMEPVSEVEKVAQVPDVAEPEQGELPEKDEDAQDPALTASPVNADPPVPTMDPRDSNNTQKSDVLAPVSPATPVTPVTPVSPVTPVTPITPVTGVTEGRQMLGDDYAESSASDASDIIPPKVLLNNQHRHSLVPSLHSGDDNGSEEHRFSFGGETSTLDGGSSEASDSELGSVSSQTLAGASLAERMEIMKLRVKKSKDRYHAFEAARFIVDNVQFVDKAEQKQNCELAIKQLKKLSIAGLVDAQYLLANLYISGIPGFQEKHKADYAKAFNLYSSAAKKDHPEALFHVGLCYEQGAGVAQSNNRALHNYRKAAVSNHPGAMFRLGMCLLRGELNQSKNPRDGVKWLKLAAKYATEKYPQALYELALLHDHGVHNVVWPDHEYLIELLTQGAGLGHGGCQFKLGEAFEYGYFGVVVDPGRSVYYYSLAAANGNLEAMFELGGWYLTGASDPNTTFTLIQSDTEAYRWVSLAADGGLPKAMFAMGYFCEMGIGRDAAAAPGDAPQQPTSAPDLALALEWYEKAAAKGDTKAANKVAELRGTTPTTPSKRNSRMPPASSAGKARKGSAASLSASAAASATASAAAPSSTPAAPQPSQPSQPQSAGIPRSAPSNGAESSTSAKVDKKDKKKKKRGCLIM